MRGIVGFRLKHDGPVIELFNIAGAGIDHIDKKAGLYAAAYGYDYFEILYNRENKMLNCLVGRGPNGVPYVKERKK